LLDFAPIFTMVGMEAVMRNLLKKINRGNIVILRWVLALILIIGAVTLSALLIVYPLWYAAVHWQQYYTLFSLLLIGSGILFLVISKFLKKINSFKGKSIIRFFIIIILFSLLYVIIILFAEEFFIFAIILSILFFVSLSLLIANTQK
jgi:hypothetical protein